MTSHLEPERAQRAEWADLVSGYLGDWLDEAQTMPASGADPDEATLRRLSAPPEESGRDLGSILADLDLANQGGIYHPSGGHLSYIPNAGLYSGALADFLATGLNRYTGIAAAAPGFGAIEHGVIEWMAGLFGLGPSASGLLLSGGSMANLTAVVAARVLRLGDDFSRGVIYVSPHTHHSVEKAARVAGFRHDQVVKVGIDHDLRMDPDSLVAAVRSDRQAGLKPFLVVSSAGTTDTGTVDPLADIAQVAVDEGLWCHVDAAYGGFFQLTRRGERVLAGIELADSITLDPHKGLSLPFGCGALLVREEAALVEANAGRGAYLSHEDEFLGLRDIASLGPELSRPNRGLTVWLPLQLHGLGPFREALDAALDLAEHAHDRLRGISGVRSPWKPDLSVVAFGFDDDDAGRTAMETVNAERKVHLSSTSIDGRFVLRLAILNRRTTTDHVDHALDLVEKTLIG